MQVLWTEAYPTQIDGIWIKPGWNEIPDSLRGHRVVRHLINRGRLSIKAEDPAEQTPLEKDLAGIRATFDLKILRKIDKADDRPEVHEAIEAQVAEIQRLKDEARAAEKAAADG
jgi:hypothetical protein